MTGMRMNRIICRLLPAFMVLLMAAGFFSVSAPASRVAYAEENGDSESLETYRNTVLAELSTYAESLIVANHLSDSTANEVRSVIASASAQLYATSDMTLFADIGGNARLMMDAVVEGSQSTTKNFLALTSTYRTPTVYAGETVTIVLPLVSYADAPLSDVVLTAKIDPSVTKWPFVPDAAGAVQTIKSFPPYKNDQPVNNIDMNDVRQDVSYVFKVRDDAKTGYYPLTFHFVYKRNGNEEEGDLTSFVNVIGKAENGSLESESAPKSQPRIIVTGFETEPARVKAGETFTVKIHVQNTASAQSVTNVLFDLQAAQEGKDSTNTYAAFLPTSGSSSIYVNSIAPQSIHDLAIEMTAKADLAEKPYVLQVKMKYDYGEQFNLEDTASVSIPIYQAARCETGDAEVTPGEISVGQQANVTFSVYNTGKTTLNNVWVKFKGDSITGGDTYLGNLASGGTGNTDAMLTGVSETTDDGRIVAEISFENEQGEVTTVEKELYLMVLPEDMGFDDFGYETDFPVDEPEKKGPGLYLIIGLIAAVIVLLIFIRWIIVKRKRRRARRRDYLDTLEEDDLLSGTGFREEEPRGKPIKRTDAAAAGHRGGQRVNSSADDGASPEQTEPVHDAPRDMEARERTVPVGEGETLSEAGDDGMEQREARRDASEEDRTATDEAAGRAEETSGCTVYTPSETSGQEEPEES